MMAPHELLFMNYNRHFWDGAVKVDKDEIEVGDVLILGDRQRPLGWFTKFVEVRVLSVNGNDTATVMLRGGGVENVRLDNLKRPDWNKLPRYWISRGPRTIPHYRRPTNKDDMLKHGVAVVCVIDYDSDGNELDDAVFDAQRIDYSDFMLRDFLASMESAPGPPILNRLNLRI